MSDWGIRRSEGRGCCRGGGGGACTPVREGRALPAHARNGGSPTSPSRSHPTPLLPRCGLSHPLDDEDVVQIVKKKVKEEDPNNPEKKYVRISDREKKKALKT